MKRKKSRFFLCPSYKEKRNQKEKKKRNLKKCNRIEERKSKENQGFFVFSFVYFSLKRKEKRQPTFLKKKEDIGKKGRKNATLTEFSQAALSA